MIIFIFYVKTINYWSNLCNRDPAIDTELSHVVSLIIFSSSLTLLISRVLTVRLITNTFGQTHTHFLSRWNPSFASSTKKKGSATKKVFGCWTQFFYFRFFFCIEIGFCNLEDRLGCWTRWIDTLWHSRLISVTKKKVFSAVNEPH